MDPRWSNDAENREIPLGHVRRKEGSTTVDVRHLNNNDADPSTLNISEETILTHEQRLQLNESRENGHESYYTRKRNDETQEKRKKVLTRDLTGALWNLIMLHLVPVGGAIALIVVNAKASFYGSDGTWVPALQFVAKAHEILMQISIVAVTVAYLQYLLTHKRAVPFGAIFSAYQVTQMSYLWSPEFRATLTAANFPAVMKVPFLLFVSFSILLATAVGPSSAIAMQPRRVNYTLPDAGIALNITNDILYPNSFNKPGLPLDPVDDTRAELSPADGWEYLAYLPPLEDSQSGVQREFVPDGQDQTTEKLIMPDLYSTQISTSTPWWGQNGRSVSIERTIYVQYGPNSTFVTVQQIPVALSLATVSDGKFADYLGEQRNGVAITSIEMPQPYVSAYCQLNTIINESDTRPIQFPETYLAECSVKYGCTGTEENPINLAGTTDYTAITRQEILDQAKESPQGRLIWVDDVKVSSPVSGSALGVIVIQPEFCDMNNTYLTTSACVVGARWANTSSYLDSVPRVFDGTGMVAQNSISPDDPLILPNWSQQSVHLSKAWAESLNPMTNIRNRTVADNLLRALPMTDNICPTGGIYQVDGPGLTYSTGRPFLHERLIASLVANGMSHAAGATELWQSWPTGFGDSSKAPWQYVFSQSINISQMNRWTPPGLLMTFQGRIPGYAWTLQGIPIKVALLILLLYSVYILAYVAYTFITRNSSGSWSRISELTALAMNSRPTAVLKNTSGGIEKTETLQNLVSVREVEEDERLELVFKRDEDGSGPYRRVVRDRAY